MNTSSRKAGLQFCRIIVFNVVFARVLKRYLHFIRTKIGAFIRKELNPIYGE